MNRVYRQAPFEPWGSPVRQNVTRIMRAMQARRAQDGERGAALVEFALVVVLMMTLVFGIVEFSLAWNVKSQAQAAVRAGGRTASALTQLERPDRERGGTRWARPSRASPPTNRST